MYFRCDSGIPSQEQARRLLGVCWIGSVGSSHCLALMDNTTTYNTDSVSPPLRRMTSGHLHKNWAGAIVFGIG